MNPVHLHLLLNHVAIMAALFSAVIFIAGSIRKNQLIKNIALIGFVVAAVFTIPVFLTGEPAEEAVEHLPGIMESVIESHEEAAEFAIWMIEIAGVLSLASLLLKKITWFRSAMFSVVMVVISVISAASISYTGYLGGQIRHSEISGTNAGTNQQGGEQGEGQGGEEDDD